MHKVRRAIMLRAQKLNHFTFLQHRVLAHSFLPHHVLRELASKDLSVQGLITQTWKCTIYPNQAKFCAFSLVDFSLWWIFLFGGSRSKKEDQFHSASFGDLCKWPFNIHTVVFMYIGTICITHIKSKIKYLGSISQSVILRFVQVAFGTSNTWILAFFCTHVAVAAQKLLHKYLCLCLYLRLSLYSHFYSLHSHCVWIWF